MFIGEEAYVRKVSNGGGGGDGGNIDDGGDYGGDGGSWRRRRKGKSDGSENKLWWFVIIGFTVVVFSIHFGAPGVFFGGVFCAALCFFSPTLLKKKQSDLRPMFLGIGIGMTTSSLAGLIWILQ